MQGFRGKLVKGSEPEAVYWRRRAIVAGAVLALVLLVILGLKGLGGGDDPGKASVEGDAAPQEWSQPSPSTTLKRPYVPTPTPSESAVPSPEVTSTAPPVVPCLPTDLMLQVVAAFQEVRSGSQVPVSVLVASGADSTCTADLSGVQVELAAGSDVVFSSAHCEAPQGKTVTLEKGAGQTVEFTFDGLASDPGCEGDRRKLPVGDYELRARLGEAVSSPTNLRLT